MSQAGKYDPSGLSTLTPHIVCAGAGEAMEFYKQAFGAETAMRLDGPDGKLVHGMMRIGNATLMLAEEMPDWQNFGPKALKGTPVTLHLMVDNADAAIAKAEKAGAKVVMPAADMFWGDRYGQVEDPYGHRWSISHHVRDVSVEEMKKAMANMPAPG